MKQKRWIFLEESLDKNILYAFTQIFHISPLVATLLQNRGLTDAGDVKVFLEKSLIGMHDPFLMKGMKEAVERIRFAQEKDEKVTVYGDYDVDGITATSLLVMYLRHSGMNVDYYIPSRDGEGYGVHKKALEEIASHGTTLVITVDTGITAVEETEFARSLGVDMIITDHHQCKETIPSAYAVIDCKQPDSVYPFSELSGVGVAFKLLCALEGQGSEKKMLETYGDLVALGTIADVVSLLDENRLIVSYGLEKMKNRPNPGLKRVMEVARVRTETLTATDIGFMIAPRINAAGRIGEPSEAVRLFLTDDDAEAIQLAHRLDEENRNRQKEESAISESALELLENENYQNDEVLILAKENWHHGIIGIVASRIAERFYKPCILISLNDREGKGSGRSIAGFNLFEALSDSADCLEKFGGHALAAGLTIDATRISAFRERMNEYASTKITDEMRIPAIHIDHTLSTDELNILTAKSLSVMEPFGMNNSVPVFALMQAKILNIRTMTNGKHICFTVEKDGKQLDVLGFSKGDLVHHFIIGDTIDIAGEMDVNHYNGQMKLQIRIKDIRLSEPETNGETIPTYEELQAIYRYVRSACGKEAVTEDLLCLSRKITAFFKKKKIESQKLLNALMVFQVAGLLSVSASGNDITASVCSHNGQKMDILKLDVYQKIAGGKNYGISDFQ